MRIVFAGTPEIAVPGLQHIAAEFDVRAVLTGADKQAGRGKKLQFSPVKQAALQLKLPVYQPIKFDAEFQAKMAALAPDLLVVAAYWKIFPASFLALFPLGGINLHPSLLPRFRGPSPIPATILAGDSTGGITIQRLALKMDTGDILHQSRIELTGKETTADLIQNFAVRSAPLLVSVLKAIQTGTATAVAQDHSQATYCKLLKKDDGLINWQEDASTIEKKIRAFFPWPEAFTYFREKRLAILTATLYATENQQEAGDPGRVLGVDKKAGILIKTGKGILAVTRLQLQAKKEMDFQAFLNGHQDFAGSLLGV